MQVNYGESVALVGPNGAGKTTLFSIVLKEEDPDEGTVERDEWTMIGYLPQEGEAIGDETVMEVATGQAGELPKLERKLKALEEEGKVDVAEYYEAQGKYEALNNPEIEAKAKKMLRGLGYKEEDFERKAKEMSGGWVMRAHLARLLVMEPDLLMLDEPTNHLDLVSLLWFQDYLKTYSGAVLMISHDRQFMDEIVETVYEISESKLLKYKSNFSGYLVQREEAFERQHAAWKNQQKEISAIEDFCTKF
ncbi:MAG: ATP-binding cassette subfamily F protein 3, partial [Verrucomicrobiales bacterium]